MAFSEIVSSTTKRVVLGSAAVLSLFTSAIAQTGTRVPAVPQISAPITGPGKLYPEPPINVVPTAAKVEDFPYVTEEYFVSGTINEVPYTTRILVRRPKNKSAFSGTVVSEALHAGGRSLIFEW